MDFKLVTEGSIDGRTKPTFNTISVAIDSSNGENLDIKIQGLWEYIQQLVDCYDLSGLTIFIYEIGQRCRILKGYRIKSNQHMVTSLRIYFPFSVKCLATVGTNSLTSIEWSDDNHIIISIDLPSRLNQYLIGKDCSSSHLTVIGTENIGHIQVIDSYFVTNYRDIEDHETIALESLVDLLKMFPTSVYFSAFGNYSRTNQR